MLLGWVMLAILMCGLSIMLGYMQGHAAGYDEGYKATLRRFSDDNIRRHGDKCIATYTHLGDDVWRCSHCGNLRSGQPKWPICPECGFHLISWKEYQEAHRV